MASNTTTARKGNSIKKPSTSNRTRKYLIGYNGLSLLLWASLLSRIVSIIPLVGLEHVYPSSGTFAQAVQTLALAEVLHSLVGLVRAPVMTTAMQVASRLLLVWGVVGMFGDALLTGRDNRPLGSIKSAIGVASGKDLEYNQLAYFGMLVAWSVTECVRYGYFVFFLSSGGDAKAVPSWLSWMRYNLFFVLYPLGISCECWLVYNSLGFAEHWDVRYAYALKAILLIYVPGSYVLFTHMMAQRKRIMRGKQKEGTE